MLHSLTKLIILFMLTGVAFSAEAVGQAASPSGLFTGTVTGTVFDPNGALVPNALIKFESSSISTQIRSDEEGRFRIELPAGGYRVTVKFPDPDISIRPFLKYEEEDLQVVAGAIENLDILLTNTYVCECVYVPPSKDEIIPARAPVPKRMAYRKIQ